MLYRKAAPVRPRIRRPGAAEAVLLEDAVESRLACDEYGIIELEGGPRSGKTTALEHLAHRFADEPVLLLADCPNSTETERLIDASRDHVVICAMPAYGDPQRWTIAPWGIDEWIEYLLAAHRERCASVMSRVQADRRRRWAGGTAELCRLALDQMAADESLVSIKAAVHAGLRTLLTHAGDEAAVREFCYWAIRDCAWQKAGELRRQLASMDGLDARLRPLLLHRAVQDLLGAEHLVRQLREGEWSMLECMLPLSAIVEAAGLLDEESAVVERLRHMLKIRPRYRHPLAASLLHVAGVEFRPGRAGMPHLAGAFLAGLKWPGARLRDMNLRDTDLTGADLSESYLKGVVIEKTQLARARLYGARLKSLLAYGADLSGADLSFVRTANVTFRKTDLRGANLVGALLSGAKFYHCDLGGARFCRADLSHAKLHDCRFEEADFSGADLSWVDLERRVLRVAEFRGAKFHRAWLAGCDLEGMELPGADFERAMLCDAQLTGSQIPNGCFHGANLECAGLAEIQWERADLRDADLTHATFHLGSSRSGLVGSPIACEGSRTRFYTDDYDEQDFKSPEEIRKANLRGAALRGAKIHNVDFYLVDLRDAIYTTDH